MNQVLFRERIWATRQRLEEIEEFAWPIPRVGTPAHPAIYAAAHQALESLNAAYDIATEPEGKDGS